MIEFRVFTEQDIAQFVKHRDGEKKIGEVISFLPNHEFLSVEELRKHPAQFILLGIPEDIGVQANGGIAGAATAWRATLSALLNMQHNHLLNVDRLMLLGQFDVEIAKSTNIEQLRVMVEKIDEAVAKVIETIVLAGKTPLIIGGGHNNCFPIMKGFAKAMQDKINVINIDAHADLRNPCEGRHSGNGFSSAIEQGFLFNYHIVGLQKQYLNQFQLDFINTHPNIKVDFFDEMLLNNSSLTAIVKKKIEKSSRMVGIEIDLDSIVGVLASASGPTGFSFNELRKMLLTVKNDFAYLHICEGAAKLEDGRVDNNAGKAIAYLLSDVML